MLGSLFVGRALPFDSDAARAYAEIVAARRAAGHSSTQADCQIAAIARSQGMTMTTRNTRDFMDTGDECRLIANNPGSFAGNPGSDPPMDAINSGRQPR